MNPPTVRKMKKMKPFSQTTENTYSRPNKGRKRGKNTDRDQKMKKMKPFSQTTENTYSRPKKGRKRGKNTDRNGSQYTAKRQATQSRWRRFRKASRRLKQ